MVNTRVKIPRLVLIEKIQAAIDKEIAEYEAEMKVYEAKIEKLRPAFLNAIKNLEAKVSAMSEAELDEFIISSTSKDWHSRTAMLWLDVKLPERPHALDLRYKEQSKRILEASTDETISVSSRDAFYHYL